VSIESHGRRLDALEARRGASSGRDYIAAVYEADRLRDQEKAAAMAMIAFARALAGTNKLRRPLPGGAALPDQPAETSPRMPAPRAPEPPRERRRPSPTEVITWQEAMQIPWHDGVAESLASSPFRQK
jgi:hypothetical protein